jgi:hypothetical protein
VTEYPSVLSEVLRLCVCVRACVLQNGARFAFSEPAHIFLHQNLICLYRISLKFVTPARKGIGKVK